MRFLDFRFWLTILALLVAQAALATPYVPYQPDVNAKSWILVDYQTGDVLTSHKADVEMPQASLTKLMTAYIVEKQIDRGLISENDMVPISVKAWRTNGSTMFLEPNTKVKLSELMKGLIVVSGNDAAVALAEYVAGSTQAFAQMMNAEARAMGLSHTHFMNPTGMPHKDHYSSARDLATLTAHIIRDFPKHFKLYDIKKFTYNDITQPNRVLLLWRDPRVDGMKTGHTKAAGYCEVTTAINDKGMRVIAVVMDTASPEARADESEKLISYGFRYFQNYTPYQGGKALVSPRVWLGESNKVDLGLAQDLTLSIPYGTQKKLDAKLEVNPDITAPIKKGQTLGHINMTLDGKSLKKVPLVALQDVPEAGFFARIWDHIVMFFMSFIG